MIFPIFPLLAAALQRHADLIQTLKPQVASIEDEDMAEDFEAIFSVVSHDLETDDALAALEARIGMSVPPALRALYQSMGSFEVLPRDTMRHMDVCRVDDLLESAGHVDFDAAWPSLMGALCTFGSREEFSGLEPESQAVLTNDYVVFGWAHHRYVDRTLLVFDRDGAFHAVPYEHDVDEETWILRYQPIVHKTAPAVSLDELLATHVAAATERMQELFDDGEYLC